VDTAENLGRLILAVEGMVEAGVLAPSAIDVIRVEKLPTP
jgi:hypothetical protein